MQQHSALLDDSAATSQVELPADVPKLLGKRLGNYVVDRPLARGGMGSVFVAKHPHLEREVAVKFLDQDVSTRADLSKRFHSEARVTANLKHPNIVEILDFGELEGRLYYMMELLRGCSLRAHMRAQGRFSVQELELYLSQICAGLEAAHAAGVVHRDLKPGNVFVLEGERPQIKLLDFGVAKIMSHGEAETRHGQVLGTPTHMSPEQAMGDVHRISPLSDLYSLGVIAYEMLTGVPVFQHESEMMVLIMHVRDPVRPIRELVPEVDAGVAEIVEACLSKDPKGRPPSARALAEWLERAVYAAERGPLPRALPAAVELRGEAPTQASPHGEAATLGVEPSATLSGAPRWESTEPAAAPLRLPSLEPVVAPSLEPAALPSLEPAVAPVAPAPTTLISPEAPARGAVSAPPARGSAEAVRVTAPAARDPGAAARLGDAATLAAEYGEPRVAERAARARPELSERARAESRLNATAESTLNKLLLRLKRKGDFPAFAQSVGEVSKKADANSAYSAAQLGESILKDYALTAKLLRMINSMYARRFGGKIYSVHHAIVLLGFDRIRSLALSISLFKGSPKTGQARRISDSAIASLVSGEIAKTLAAQARVNDEEALVCAMFRDLGRHLVLVYLPELYDEVLALAEQEGVSLAHAAERVLGTTFPKLGVAVAQSWRLPPSLVNAAAALPSGGGPLQRPEDRLGALSEFANDLCEIVANTPASTREREVAQLLARHNKLVSLEPDAIPELLRSVREAFQERYARLLGLDVQGSRFLNGVAELAGEGAVAADTRESPPALPDAPHGPHGAAAPARAAQPAAARPPKVAADLGSAAPAPPPAVVAGARAGSHVVARLTLAKRIVPAAEPEPAASLEPPVAEAADADVEAIGSALAARLPPDVVLERALALAAKRLGAARVLLLAPGPTPEQLVVRGGLHDDLEALIRELKIPLGRVRGGTNLFASACRSGKDAQVRDAFAPQAMAGVPARYYEALGAAAFALYACLSKGLPTAILMVNVESAEELPSAERVLGLARLRPLLAQAAALR